MNYDLIFENIKNYIEQAQNSLLFIDFTGEMQDDEEKALPSDFNDIDKYISENKGEAFSKVLFSFIDSRELTDSEVYKKAGINRRVFSNIRCKPNSVPVKKNVLAFCLALELKINDAKKLLASAGYSFVQSDTTDLIIMYCLENKIYSLKDINVILEHFGTEKFSI